MNCSRSLPSALFFASLLAITTSCTQNTSKVVPSPQEPSVSTTATPVVTTSPTPSPQSQSQDQNNYLANAIKKANQANAMAKSAVSNDDWALVVKTWQQSIDLLKQIPKSNAEYAQAQTKLKNYNSALASAKSRTNRSTTLPSDRPLQISATSAMSMQQFLEQVYFDEVINRGGSGESLWCSDSEILQTSLFAPRDYEILSINTVPAGTSGSVKVRIESSNRGGQPVIANWLFIIDKGQTVGERNYRQLNSPVSAQGYRNFAGGWCVSLVTEG